MYLNRNLVRFPAKINPPYSIPSIDMRNEHYYTNIKFKPIAQITAQATQIQQRLDRESELHVEERFGRNMQPTIVGERNSKFTLKKRIALAFRNGGLPFNNSDDHINHVMDDHVYLFPCGMNAIYSAFKLAVEWKPNSRTIQFG